jgi:hypothetical protein
MSKQQKATLKDSRTENNESLVEHLTHEVQ